MLLYILLSFIIIITLFFAYVRIKYQFWALQPVFHYYDIFYWFYNKGIIRQELPQKNRYTNLKDIITFDFIKLTKNQIKEAVNLIQYNYLRNKNGSNYYPKENNIVPYFNGHFAPCYWSYFWKPNNLLDSKTGNIIEDKQLIGVITSRPLHVKIIKNDLYSNIDIYYVDYLCIEKSSRKKGIAPQLIQTHEYSQSYNNKKICVSLFKREDELTGIIPLTAYNSYCFNMKNWIKTNYLLDNYKILTGDKQNIYYFYNFVNEHIKCWDIVIWPEISNLVSLIDTNNLIIKMILLDKEIQAVYLFKKTCTSINSLEILDCFSSINIGLTTNNFINGFKKSLQSIRKKYPNYGYLTIEDISHNKEIINNLQLKTSPYVISPTAYFFYNFAYTTFSSKKCLIIN
jgi:hypothetical protein